MRKTISAGLLVILASACQTSNRTPNKESAVGDTVANFQSNCTDNLIHMEPWGNVTLGECVDRPGRYYAFQAGRIIGVYNSSGFADLVFEEMCPEKTSECRNQLYQTLAERDAEAALGSARYMQSRPGSNPLGTAFGTFAKSFGDFKPAPNAVTPPSFSPQQKPVIVAPQQTGTMASFTGASQQVRTVTGAMAWQCEYVYGAQKFTLTFAGFCPSSAQIQ